MKCDIIYFYLCNQHQTPIAKNAITIHIIHPPDINKHPPKIKLIQETCTFIHIVQKTCTIVNMKNEIGENIKALRKMHGMTQGDLALILGGKKSLVSNYENGYSTPDIYTLIKLADVFDVSLDELVGRK